MKGLKPELIPVLVERDVRRVEENAALILRMKDGNIVQKLNPKPIINIIAVIGPGQAFEMQFKEAVLCEIGMGRSRPYHEAKGVNFNTRKKEGESSIAKRRKWFSLSEAQYSLIAPVIFEFIQDVVDERVSCWKYGNDKPFFIRSPRNYYSRHQKRLLQSETFKPYPRGCRFSISLTDECFLRDIYWAELNSFAVAVSLSGAARFIDLYLSRYRGGYKRDFFKLKRVQELQNLLEARSFPKYLWVEMVMKYFPRGQKNVLWPKICEMVGKITDWNGEETKESKLASLTLPNPDSRLNGMQLKITQSFRENKNYVVFEVFPHSTE